MSRRPLPRGANVSITRENPDLTGVVIGLRWDTGADHVLADNLAGAALLCDADQRVLSDRHVVFFNQMLSPDLSVAQLAEVMGDDREQIEVDLPAVPPEIERIVIVVHLNEGSTARRSLAQLRSCSVRLLTLDGDRELIRSEELASELSAETALVMAQLYRYRRSSGSGPVTEWRFRIVGQGYGDGLRGVADDYGIVL